MKTSEKTAVKKKNSAKKFFQHSQNPSSPAYYLPPSSNANETLAVTVSSPGRRWWHSPDQYSSVTGSAAAQVERTHVHCQTHKTPETKQTHAETVAWNHRQHRHVIFPWQMNEDSRHPQTQTNKQNLSSQCLFSVSYTHLTLPTTAEV